MSRLLVLVLPLLVALSSLGQAYEILLPARQVERPVVAVAWQRAQQDMTLRLTSTDRVSVGALSYLTAVANDFTVATVGSGVQAKVLFQPRDGFAYWVTFGSMAYDIDIPSSAVKNRLSAQRPGWMAGCGVQKVLMPDTIVSPAVAVQVSVAHAEAGMTAFTAGSAAPVAIDTVFLTTQYRAGVVASKKCSRWEPYGGVAVMRTCATLRDVRAMSEVSGVSDVMCAKAGARLNLYPGESLVCEAGVLGEIGLLIGWTIEF